MGVRYGVREQHIKKLEDRITKLENVLTPFSDFGELVIWKETVWEKNPKIAVLIAEDDAGELQSLFMEHFFSARKVLMNVKGE